MMNNMKHTKVVLRSCQGLLVLCEVSLGFGSHIELVSLWLRLG